MNCSYDKGFWLKEKRYFLQTWSRPDKGFLHSSCLFSQYQKEFSVIALLVSFYQKYKLAPSLVKSDLSILDLRRKEERWKEREYTAKIQKYITNQVSKLMMERALFLILDLFKNQGHGNKQATCAILFFPDQSFFCFIKFSIVFMEIRGSTLHF